MKKFKLDSLLMLLFIVNTTLSLILQNYDGALGWSTAALTLGRIMMGTKNE